MFEGQHASTRQMRLLVYWLHLFACLATLECVASESPGSSRKGSWADRSENHAEGGISLSLMAVTTLSLNLHSISSYFIIFHRSKNLLRCYCYANAMQLLCNCYAMLLLWIPRFQSVECFFLFSFLCCSLFLLKLLIQIRLMKTLEMPWKGVPHRVTPLCSRVFWYD